MSKGDPAERLNDSDAVDDSRTANQPTLPEADGFSGETSEPPAPPQVLGRFKVRGVLGQGGFGIVYRGWDTRLQRDVAIKVARPQRQLPSYREWFLKEAQFLAHLDHPGIVPVFDVGETDDGEFYVVSKFIKGTTLENVIRAKPQGGAHAAATIATVAMAIAHAHRRRVVHRDLKPSNILIGEDEQPVVVDFGLAIGGWADDEAGRIVGTLAYMSPEQARGESHRVDGRADIYSLGVILYRWLTGTVPFVADSKKKLLDQIRHAEVQPPRQLCREIPRELERICLKTLSKRVSDRYTTAEDLAEDLRLWLAEESRERPPLANNSGRVAVAEGSGRDSRGHEGSHRSGSSAPLAGLIPRGLRSYGPGDSNFFLQMLPGPVDRDGIPECVRFWKQRIETDDTERGFRVGVLMGPSGSGKSSLIRAGLLPLLEPRIDVIMLEARPERLAQRFAEAFSRIRGCRSVPTDLLHALREFREQAGEGRRLLLVLDQFESFLHRGDRNDDAWLIEALRQCDGIKIQALLITRDDFLMPVARFMGELEEPLLQEVNFATIDRFGKEHARRVLTGFGVSVQMVDADGPDADARRFIKLAVEGLAEDDHVVPVRLAMLTEMLKDMPWTPTTLRQVGGLDGLGVAFLQQRLSGPQTHPQFRRHADLVRRVLDALLPSESVSIRERTMTVVELTERCGAADQRGTLEQVLQLLDSELRLITPAAGDDMPDFASPRYQLTHDYLVPSVRAWIEMQDESSHRGRRRLSLRRAARHWSLGRQPRLLGGPFAWLRWRCGTDVTQWSDVEREFMSHTRSQVVRRGFAFALVLILVGLGLQFLLRQQENQGLREAIRTADLEELPRLIERVSGQTSLPSLLRPSQDDVSAVVPNFRWALLPEHPEWILEQIASLDPLRPQQVAAAARLLARLPDQDWGDLWRQIDVLDARPRLVAAGLLGVLDSANAARMEPHAMQILEAISSLPPKSLEPWIEQLAPFRDSLVPVAFEALRREESELGRIPSILLIHLLVPGDDVHLRSELVTVVKPSELPLILDSKISAPDPAWVGEIRERFQGLTVPAEVASARLSLEQIQSVTAVSGWVDAEVIVVPSMARDEASRLDRESEVHGYRLASWRDPGDSVSTTVSAVWLRDGRRSQKIGPLLSIEQLVVEAEDAAKKGWRFEDIAYEAHTDNPGWVLLCSHTPAERDHIGGPHDYLLGLDIQLRTYTDLESLTEDETSVGVKGYSIGRWAVGPAEWDRIESVVLWTEDPGIAQDRSRHILDSYWGSFGDYYPGATPADARLLPLMTHNNAPLRERYFEEWNRGKRTGSKDRTSTRSRFRMVAYARRWEQLLEIPTGDVRDEEVTDLQHLQCLALLHLGRVEEASQRFEELVASMDRSWLQRWLTLERAVASGDPAAAEAIEIFLADVRESRRPSTKFTLFATALLAIVRDDPLPEAAARLATAVTQLPQSSWHQAILDLRGDPRFDAICEHPEFRRLAVEAGLTHYGLACWQAHSDREGTLVWGNLREHQQSTSELRRDGFVPRCVEADGDRVVSAWYRPVQFDELVTQPNTLARLAVAAAVLGEVDLLESLFDSQHGAAARDEAISAIAAFKPPASLLVDWLRVTQGAERTFSLLAAIGLLPVDRLSSSDRRYLESRTRDLQDHGDPGVVAVADWLRRTRLVETEDLESTIDAAPIGPVNESHPMIAIEPPRQVWMASHNFEPDRTSSELGVHVVGVPPYAIGQREVTVGEFRRFLEDPRVRDYYLEDGFHYSRRFAPHREHPQISVRWLDAILYCQWLSEHQGLPEEDWCFPGIWDADPEVYELPADILQRRGFRLPTEPEWEYAARAGETTTWSFGWSPELLGHYAWTRDNSNATSQPVATKLPNRFGLFDMLGNVSEWCLEPFSALKRSVDGPFRRWDQSMNREAEGGRSVNLRDRKGILRGGHYATSTAPRPAERLMMGATEQRTTIGFRLAQTRSADRGRDRE